MLRGIQDEHFRLPSQSPVRLPSNIIVRTRAPVPGLLAQGIVNASVSNMIVPNQGDGICSKRKAQILGRAAETKGEVAVEDGYRTSAMSDSAEDRNLNASQTGGAGCPTRWPCVIVPTHDG